MNCGYVIAQIVIKPIFIPEIFVLFQDVSRGILTGSRAVAEEKYMLSL